MKWLTRTKSEHIGFGSKRTVYFNGDREKFVLLKEPNQEELQCWLREYTLLRIQAFWDLDLNDVVKIGADSKRFLRAFTPPAVAKSGFAYFESNTMKKFFPSARIDTFEDFYKEVDIANQRRVLEANRPQQNAAIFDIDIGTKKLKDRLFTEKMRRDYRTCTSTLSFIDKVCQTVCVPGKRLTTLTETRYFELLCYLHSKGFLLFPLRNDVQHGGYYFFRYMKYYVTPHTLTLHNNMIGVVTLGKSYVKTNESQYLSIALMTILSNTAIEITDFSPELLAAIEQLSQQLNGRIFINPITRAIKKIWDAENPGKPFPVYKNEGRERTTQEDGRHSGTYQWALAKDRRMNKWVEYFSKYTAVTMSTRVVPNVISRLNHWLTYLMTLSRPPLCPEDVARNVHIRDVTNTHRTFTKYLTESMFNGKLMKDASRNKIIRRLRDFFEWYHDELVRLKPNSKVEFKNPISNDDSEKGVYTKRTKTHRAALGSANLNLMKQILVKNDFAWPKQFNADWQNLVNRTTNKVEKVWWPGRTVLMYLCLEYAIRGTQGRWLDSGEGDEYVYDFNQKKMVLNNDSRALKGRKEGFLQVIEDKYIGEEFVGAWITTNKTHIERSPKDVKGYSIPWCSKEVIDMINMMQEWLKKYGAPCIEPVGYMDDPSRDKRPSEAMSRVLPKFFPLFRDPRRHHSNVPISRARLTEFYSKLLLELQNQLKERGQVVKLVETGTQGKLKLRIDFHTLRVSGITALIDAGVPIGIVSEFVAGHATVLMTMYYYNPSPAKIRSVIEAAYDKIRSADYTSKDATLLTEYLDDLEPFLVFKNDDGRNDALVALRENQGLWQVDLAGICPGTSCELGGALDDRKQPTAVRGGKCCPLCRFWITGPAFLVGQVLEANNLIYRIRHEGSKLAELRMQAIELEEQKKRTDLNYVYGRIDQLEKDINHMLLEWGNRYKFAVASAELLDSYEKKKEKILKKEAGKDRKALQLITSNSLEGLKMATHQANHFILLDHISQAAEFFTEFNNEPAIVERERLLNKILVANGIEPYLLRLSRDEALKAANLLSSLLLQHAGEENVERLIDGSTRLEKLPGLSKAIKSLIVRSDVGNLSHQELIPLQKRRSLVQ